MESRFRGRKLPRDYKTVAQGPNTQDQRVPRYPNSPFLLLPRIEIHIVICIYVFGVHFMARAYIIHFKTPSVGYSSSSGCDRVMSATWPSAFVDELARVTDEGNRRAEDPTGPVPGARQPGLPQGTRTRVLSSAVTSIDLELGGHLCRAMCVVRNGRHARPSPGFMLYTYI